MAKASGKVRNPYTSRRKSVSVTSGGQILKRSQIKAILNGNLGSISDLPDREVQRQLQRGISRFERVLGIREKDIKIGDLVGAYGVTTIGADGSHGIILSRQVFSGKREQIEREYVRNNYDNGYKAKTNRAIQHTITHELAHATWSSMHASQNARAAGKAINNLYTSFLKDDIARKARNWGSYATENVDEFWAEAVTRGIHGKSDYYSRTAIKIARQYKL